MGVDANRLFMHQPNDSAETIKLGMSPVGESGSTNSESSGSVEEDEITKCISDLNIFDLLHNNPPSSSDDNEEGAGTGGGLMVGGRMGVERLTVIGSGYQQQGQQQQQQPSLVHPAPATVVMGPAQGDSGALAQPPGGYGVGVPKHRTPLRKLKSSLKLASQSQSSCSSTSLSSSKSVRFAPQLATVKRFDLNSEPMSISNENSPALTSLDQLLGMESTVMDKFWFGAPVFNRLKSKIPLSKGVPKFTLDYDSDDSDEKQFDDDTADDDYSSFDSSEEEDAEDADEYGEATNLFGNGVMDGDAVLSDRFTISHWELQSSNLSSFQAVASSLPLQEQLFTFLQGHNIKLNKVSLLDMHTVRGSLYVANLHFEKFIEVKFSFNEWKDIHYVTAQYLRTVTSKIDEFKFTIDLSSYKYFMQVKNLLYCDPKKRETHCPITMALCCRYDVNGETYYDNNNYENYQINACCLTVPSMPTVPVGRTRTRAKILAGGYSNCKDTSPKPSGVYSPVRSNKHVPLRKSLSHDFLLNFSQKHSPVYPGQSPNSPSIAPSSARPSIGRTFSEDTDYFNTSPLKHIYHFDSTKQCSSTDSSSTIVESEHFKRSKNNDTSPSARKGFSSPPSDNEYIHDSLDSATISSVTSLHTPRNRREFLSSPDLSSSPSDTDDSHVQDLHAMKSKKSTNTCNDFAGFFQSYDLYPAATAPPSINSSDQNYNNSFLSKTACVSQSPSANHVP